ncbi:GRF1-interacting factor 1 [Vitis vinifera]|uniref:GRF1-interacting factor 1 n=1 Tax=Vitis vinifera TaxID=29760 RepID=A0A438F0M9_VITVI|nr:GRF1-interacting factor 1 [Vitis vinifera]
MQQHLMQMQPMMAGSHNLSSITTDHIQQYLDENKSLILKILESQNSGKLSECADKTSAKPYVPCCIADCQPQPPSLQAQREQSGGSPCGLTNELVHPPPPYIIILFSPNMVMQPGVNYMQHQQSQQMMPQSLMAARAPMVYAQQHPYLALQQQQALQSQLGMSSTGMGGIHMLQSEPNVGGNGTGAFSDLGRSMTGEGLSAVSRGLGSASKQDVGSVGSAEGRRGYLGGQGADKGEALYFKSAEERD